MSTVTVSPKFQIVIPKEVRQDMRLKAGDKFSVWRLGNVIELVKVRPIHEMRGVAKGMDFRDYREKKDREL